MGNSGKGLGIVALIIAMGALGLGVYPIILPSPSEGPRTIVVGIWDELEDNLDYAPHNLQDNWLFEFGAHNLSNTDYISISNNNTRIALLKSGWYRIHLSVALGSIGPSSKYWIAILEDGAPTPLIYFDRLYTGSTFSDTVHIIDSSAFVYSDGTTYIEIVGTSDDDFWVSLDSYNQLSIEYVAI